MMTREEAIKALRLERGIEINGNAVRVAEFLQGLDVAISALRPVSREQVEKVWTGCEKCRDQANWPSWIEKGVVYCPKCGTPLTSWAWKKQMERVEAITNATD